jgi:nucleoside-diphosphate-sugar epimerase
MSTTIAIIGHNGNVGKKVLPHLIKAHQAGQIKLVVLHRPSSAIDSVPSYVEKRVIAGTDPDSLKEVVKGVHVLL